MTYEERKIHIAMHAATQTFRHRKDADLWRAHIARLHLIYAPFPVVRRIGTGSALPWGGTIVNDTFYGTNAKPSAPKQATDVDSGYNGLYAHVEA